MLNRKNSERNVVFSIDQHSARHSCVCVCGMNNQNKYENNTPQNLQIAAMNEWMNKQYNNNDQHNDTNLMLMMMIIATMIDSNLTAW